MNKSSFIHLLARLTGLQPDHISIVRIEAGSVIVTLELPESTARWLVDMYEQRAPLIDLLDIQEVRDLQVLPAPDAPREISFRASESPSRPPISDPRPEPAKPALPGVAERLKTWLQGWRSLSFAGALVAALLVIALIAILRTSALPLDTPGGSVAQRAPVGV